MKLRAFAVLVVMSILPLYAAAIPTQAPAAATPQPTEKVYDLASFAAELQRLYKELQTKSSPIGIKEFRDGLPPSWNVSVPGRRYSISTKPLRDQLGGESPDNARVWFSHLQAEIRSAQRLGVQPLPAAHAQLNKILAGRAFAGVRPPTYLELLRARVSAWLERMLLKLFSGLSRHPIGAKALFWVVLITGVAFIAFWIFRFIAGRDSMNFFQPGTTTVTARTWQEWIGAAREAAARGDFREAVHSAYWAGILACRKPERCRTTALRHHANICA